MRLWNSFKMAFAMYSKIPIPESDWTEENMRYVMCFFPIVGVVIGSILSAIWYLLWWLNIGIIFRTAVIVLLPVILTGGIHLDGMLDTSDALSSYQPMERKLEILKDSHSGAFAIIACCAYFLASFGIWSEVKAVQLPVLAAGFVLSRALSGFGVVTLKCAKNSGLAVQFHKAGDRTVVRIVTGIIVIISILFMLWVNIFYGGIAAASAVVLFFYYRSISYRKFGGITGDLAGFFLQICELGMGFTVVMGGYLCI